MDPTTPINRAPRSVRETPPATGTSGGSHQRSMVSLLTMLIPLLLAILGCGLGGATPSATPPSASVPHPTGFAPDTDTPPAPLVTYGGPPTGSVDLSI